MTTADDRAATAAQLKQEAGLLLGRSGLFKLLEERFGKVKITGSAGYDLMVWRDIDIHMPVEASKWADWAYLVSEIARQFQDKGLVLHRATYWNDYVDPHPLGAGLYWGIEFRDFEDHPWKCDLWGWEPFDFEIRDSRDDSLRSDLARADRDLILRLKTEAREREDYYGRVVGSFDIYQFCIQRAGETLEELEAWKGSQA
ncbi:MAG TPA: hypothetical protein VIN06_06500 [Devosia sp.]